MIDIKIIGGPFDGLQHRFGGDINTLQHDLVWLVCEDAFSQFGYRFATRHDRVTSVAVYTLKNDLDVPSYHYFGSISALDFSKALGNPLHLAGQS